MGEVTVSRDGETVEQAATRIAAILDRMPYLGGLGVPPRSYNHDLGAYTLNLSVLADNIERLRGALNRHSERDDERDRELADLHHLASSFRGILKRSL